jgi:hypothetical protein
MNITKSKRGSSVAGAAPKKKQKQAEEKFIFEAHLGQLDIREGFTKSKEAAKRAWEFCELHEVEIFAGDWWTDTRHGEQECSNVMISKEDFEPDEEFIKFMSRRGSRDGATLKGPDGAEIKVAPR